MSSRQRVQLPPAPLGQTPQRRPPHRMCVFSRPRPQASRSSVSSLCRKCVDGHTKWPSRHSQMATVYRAAFLELQVFHPASGSTSVSSVCRKCVPRRTNWPSRHDQLAIAAEGSRSPVSRSAGADSASGRGADRANRHPTAGASVNQRRPRARNPRGQTRLGQRTPSCGAVTSGAVRSSAACRREPSPVS